MCVDAASKNNLAGINPTCVRQPQHCTGTAPAEPWQTGPAASPAAPGGGGWVGARVVRTTGCVGVAAEQCDTEALYAPTLPAQARRCTMQEEPGMTFVAPSTQLWTHTHTQPTCQQHTCRYCSSPVPAGSGTSQSDCCTTVGKVWSPQCMLKVNTEGSPAAAAVHAGKHLGPDSTCREGTSAPLTEAAAEAPVDSDHPTVTMLRPGLAAPWTA